jgi:hypothetical protein
MEDAHRQGDVGAAEATRNPLTVPPREELAKRGRDVSAETEVLGQDRGDQAMTLDALGDPVPTGRKQGADRTCPMSERATGPGVAEEERESRHPTEVDVIAVGAEGDVVAEARRNFRRVGHAADPRQHRDVEQGGTIDGDAQPVLEPDSDLPGPQQVRHRLTEPEVGRQGEGRQQVGQRDVRAVGGLVHGDVRSVTGGPPPDRVQSLELFVCNRSGVSTARAACRSLSPCAPVVPIVVPCPTPMGQPSLVSSVSAESASNA